MKKIGIAVFALMFAGVAYVGAQEMEIDFDGEIAVKGQVMEKFSMPKAFSDIEYNIPVPKREVKHYDQGNKSVNALLDNSNITLDINLSKEGQIIKEKLICNGMSNINDLKSCKKQSSKMSLTLEDVEKFGIRKFFPKNGKPISFIPETKHSYTNTSGPQTFQCNDFCRHWVTYEVEVGCHSGVSGWSPDIGCQTVTKKKCGDWTHKCECISNCYD